MSLDNISSIATYRSVILSFNLWISIFCLSVLWSLSNNVQVLKIVVLVQDSNLIIGKVHGFLMLYAS